MGVYGLGFRIVEVSEFGVSCSTTTTCPSCLPPQDRFLRVAASLVVLVRQAAVLVRLVRLVRDAAFLWCANRSVVVHDLVRESLVRESKGEVCESAGRSAPCFSYCANPPVGCANLRFWFANRFPTAFYRQ